MRPLAESIGVDLVSALRRHRRRADRGRVRRRLRERWSDGLDAVVHSLAFAAREDLKGRFVETSRQGFHLALDVSAYSLVAMARAAEPLLTARRGAL